MAHITGGGITDNLPRILPDGTAALVRPSSWHVPPVFTWLQKKGGVPHPDMLRTFNMGVGLILATAPDHADSLAEVLAAPVIGEVVAGEPSVTYL
jgi:phosphoribosylformylglycinamidine cyclo-ligase